MQKSELALGRVQTIGLLTTYVPTEGFPNYAISTNTVFTQNMQKLAWSKNSPRSTVSGIFTTVTLQKSAFVLGHVQTIGLFATYVPTAGSPNLAISTNAVFIYTIFHQN